MSVPSDGSRVAEYICQSYRHWTGRTLVPPSLSNLPPHSALEQWNHIVLAHTPGNDPRFHYANPAAQALFELPRDQFLGMPSKFSAEAEEREARAALLREVAEQGYIDTYSGIRISAGGIRFRIHQATVWNLLDAEGLPVGQAAHFSEWTYLPIAFSHGL